MSNLKNRASAYRTAWLEESGFYTALYPNRLVGKAPGGKRFGKPSGEKWAKTYLLPHTCGAALNHVGIAYIDLRASGNAEASAFLPQIEAGLEELYRIAGTYEHNKLARKDIIELAGDLAALIDMVRERELVMKSIDHASLARTGEALQADLASARKSLQSSDLEWKLDRATQAHMVGEAGETRGE